jgi:copper chaperone CopZ
LEKITLKVDGMMCGMCEAHVNEAIRGAFPVKKVTSSHTKGETVILTDAEIDEDKLKETVAETGYTVLGIEKEPYEKKGFFARRK